MSTVDKCGIEKRSVGEKIVLGVGKVSQDYQSTLNPLGLYNGHRET
jgi:hypothetical protein